MNDNESNNMDNIEIEKVYQGEKAVIYIKGRIDTQTAPEFQAYLDEYFDDGERILVLDFNEVEYLSSAGLRTILYAKKRVDNMEEENADISIINVNSMVMEIFEMTGFTDLISIIPKSKSEC